MDMFYENISFTTRKKRIHYSNFMLEIHQKLFTLKSSEKKNAKDSRIKPSFGHELKDVWSIIADDIANEYDLLCLDEFQVTDIADAMILKYLFTALFQHNVVVIMTSNRPPQDLYKNGLQRDLFIPFIHLLQQRAEVHSIKDSPIDYRLLKFKEKIGIVSIVYIFLHLTFYWLSPAIA